MLLLAPCDRPPRFDGQMLQGWFPGSGVVRVRSSDRLGAFPNPVEGRWLLCRVQRSTTVAGAAPAFTGFPILPPVVDGQAPSAQEYYLILSRLINDSARSQRHYPVCSQATSKIPSSLVPARELVQPTSGVVISLPVDLRRLIF